MMTDWNDRWNDPLYEEPKGDPYDEEPTLNAGMRAYDEEPWPYDHSKGSQALMAVQHNLHDDISNTMQEVEGIRCKEIPNEDGLTQEFWVHRVPVFL